MEKKWSNTKYPLNTVQLMVGHVPLVVVILKDFTLYSYSIRYIQYEGAVEWHPANTAWNFRSVCKNSQGLGLIRAIWGKEG